jgi:hypothetical protein
VTKIRKKSKNRQMDSESDNAEESINNKYLRSHQRSDRPLNNSESVLYDNLNKMSKSLKEALRVNKILQLLLFIFDIFSLLIFP